jgi:hypothetical protein
MSIAPRGRGVTTLALIVLSTMAAAVAVALIVTILAYPAAALGAKSAAVLAVSLSLTAAVTGALVVMRSSSRPISLRIALVGAPQVGKTVYANVLYELLLDARGPRGLRFTPESSSARSVVSTMRGLSRGEWPKSTRTDGVYQYRGLIERGGTNALSRLTNGGHAYRLEIGDAAGELWVELAEDGEAQEEIIESNFFEYALESDVLFLFISSEHMVRDPRRVRKDVDDIIGVLRLLSAAGGASRPLTPIALLVSKSDLLSAVERRVLDSIQGAKLNAQSDPLDAGFEESLAQVQRLYEVAARLNPSVRFFTVSSLAAAVDTGMTEWSSLGLQAPDEAERIRHRHALLPLLWSLQRPRRWP